MTPNTSTEGGSSTWALVPITRLAASSSGATGPQDCQASITAAASEKGQVRWKFVAAGARTVPKVRAVTTPKLPGPAPASERPEQVFLVVIVALQDPTVRQDDLHPEQMVGGKPVLPTDDPESPTESQSGDPDRRTGAGRNSEVPLQQRFVDLAEPCASPHRDRAARDLDGMHRRDVHQEPLSGGAPAEAVAAASRRHGHPLLACKVDALGNVLGGPAPDDRVGPHIVESGIERPVRSLIVGRAGKDYITGDRRLQRSPGPG